MIENDNIYASYERRLLFSPNGSVEPLGAVGAVW